MLDCPETFSNSVAVESNGIAAGFPVISAEGTTTLGKERGVSLRNVGSRYGLECGLRPSDFRRIAGSGGQHDCDGVGNTRLSGDIEYQHCGCCRGNIGVVPGDDVTQRHGFIVEADNGYGDGVGTHILQLYVEQPTCYPCPNHYELVISLKTGGECSSPYGNGDAQRHCYCDEDDRSDDWADCLTTAPPFHELRSDPPRFKRQTNTRGLSPWSVH